MPVPQENLVFVEQASCLFIKPDLKLKMVQRLSYFPLNLWIPISVFIVPYSASHGIAEVYFTAFVHLLEMLTIYIPPLAR